MRILLFLTLLYAVPVMAQRPFAHEGAIPADSAVFSGWAVSCTLQRSYQDISNESLGYTTVGDAASAKGAARQNGVVSLGDGGKAILTFAGKIFNGPGADFAVFENGFAITGDTLFHCELAFVEVSSDGSRYVRFPSLYLGDTAHQKDNFGGNDPRSIFNLAGNYTYGYGTPFDLEDVKDSAGLDVSSITHIRIVDVVGSLTSQYARRDASGNMINDPWPTPFPSSGFDLDAVGAIHLNTNTGFGHLKQVAKNIYPNPARAGETLFLEGMPGVIDITVLDLSGRLVSAQAVSPVQPVISLKELTPGVYMLCLKHEGSVHTQKLIIE